MTESSANESSHNDGRLDALLSQHLPGLRGFLQRRAPEYVLDRESAEDLAQSVCRDVLEHAADGRFELRGDSEFKQWLYEAALWKLRARGRHLRAQKRDVAREVRPTSGSQSLGHEACISATPSRLVATEERRAAVREAIHALGGRDEELLRLAVLEELPHRQIAERLDITEAHSRVLLSRALAKLARHLEP